MGEKIKIEQVPIDKIALDIRDDINLRTYVLLNRAGHVWKQFLKGANAHGLKPRSYESFLELYQDIRVNGIKEPIKAQKINGRYYLEDGAHRLSIARSLGMKFIDVEIVTHCGIPSVFVAKPKTVDIPFPIDQNNPRIFKIFKHIPAETIEKFADLELATDTEKIPMKGAAVFWPMSHELWEEMLEDLKGFHEVKKITVATCSNREDLHAMIIDFYKSDDVALWKVEAKFPYCDNVPMKFMVLEFAIEDARHRIKRKTGNEISMAIEDLKSFIRSTYRRKISNYPSNGTPDLIIHAGDNEYQTAEILETLNRFKDKIEIDVLLGE